MPTKNEIETAVDDDIVSWGELEPILSSKKKDKIGNRRSSSPLYIMVIMTVLIASGGLLITAKVNPDSKSGVMANTISNKIYSVVYGPPPPTDSFPSSGTIENGILDESMEITQNIVEDVDEQNIVEDVDGQENNMEEIEEEIADENINNTNELENEMEDETIPEGLNLDVTEYLAPSDSSTILNETESEAMNDILLPPST